MFNLKRKKPLSSNELKEALLEMAENGTPKQKQKLYDLVMSELFPFVTIRSLSESWASLTDEEQADLAYDADLLMSNRMYSWSNNTIHKILCDNLYNKSKNEFDFAINKVGLWLEQKRRELISSVAEHKKVVKYKRLK